MLIVEDPNVVMKYRTNAVSLLKFVS